MGMVICVFLLLSWAFLPKDKTRRHWLSICLVIGIIMEAVSKTRPVLAKEVCLPDVVCFRYTVGSEAATVL